MTRFEFLMKVEQYKNCEITEMDMITAAEAWEKALIAAKPIVSSIREFVAQKLDYWVEADDDEFSKAGKWEKFYAIDIYSELLKLIDAQKPVAV